ncbi:n-alkane-inducible cytochrome P450 [Aspergillus violaceofuscus CBS 115571]|uniref:N-alkane-inducible cytochrome P450 n=1 Tax=Aspergillus violaceofuscus (strain CBS 115571) TaxID=1450538 RepID=A0A2V5IAH1_ASPV1|nr:n-alkane-inducible cytochrome P450 [Aspergillus violaceofuscus CBS 115571]
MDTIKWDLVDLRLWHLVLTLSLPWWISIYLKRRRQNAADELFGQQHGCQPIQRKLPYKWPLGLDVFKSQYDALARGQLLAYQADYFQRFRVGQTFEIRLLGRVGYFTMDPKNLEFMLQTRFDDWELGNSRDALLPMIGTGIFTQDGLSWKHSRQLLRRQFARIQNQDTEIFDRPIDDLLTTLRSCPGDIVDLQPAFFQFTLATTILLIFGEESVGGLEPSDHARFAHAFDYTSLISAMRMRLADWCWAYNPRAYRDACGVIRQYATHYVNHALDDMRANGEESAATRHPFILDLLKELRSPELVRDQLLNVLIAGRDTTACLMSWACYQLVRHPASLERLRQEIHSITKSEKQLTRAQINKMPYLRYVLNETNRLYTQIPVNVRLARRTTYLPRGGGPSGDAPLLIPKGTGVGFSAYHMHRSQAIYGPDAEAFRPERWAGPQLKNLGFAFMPFHGGPRICLGKDFALTEASFGLIRLIQAFPKLRKAPDAADVTPGQETQTLTLVVSSAEGCKVQLG